MIPAPRQTPLLPEAGAAGLPLTMVVAILAFLAALAMAANLMIAAAVTEWTGDLTGAVTVQIKGEDAELIAAEAEVVSQVLRAAEGVSDVEVLSRADTEDLLSPWFGDGLPADVPVPGLVTAKISPEARAELAVLRAALAEAAPGASLDDHGAFNDRLIAAGGRVKGLAFLIFALVTTAAGAVIVFAARAGLAANREIIEVMHLIGAADDFIAGQVQRRYFLLGLRGGLIGVGTAALILLGLSALGGGTLAGGEGAFLPEARLTGGTLLWLLIVPLILCVVAAVSARIAVLKRLRAGF